MERDRQTKRQREKKRGKEEGETEERKREEWPAFRFSTQFFWSPALRTMVFVEGRAGRSVWARDDARHRGCKGKTE